MVGSESQGSDEAPGTTRAITGRRWPSLWAVIRKKDGQALVDWGAGRKGKVQNPTEKWVWGGRGQLKLSSAEWSNPRGHPGEAPGGEIRASLT